MNVIFKSFMSIPRKVILIGVFMTINHLPCLSGGTTVYQGSNLHLFAPCHGLDEDGLTLSALPSKAFTSWSKADYTKSYELLQKLAFFFQDKQKDYLFYGQQFLGPEETPFSWQCIPFQRATWGSFSKLSMLIFRLASGSRIPSTPCQGIQSVFSNEFVLPKQEQKNETQASVFCDKKVIEKQQVFEGRYTRVFYNYAPAGDGELPLHFLVVPKVYKKSILELSLEEYQEVQSLSSALITHFVGTKTLQSAHLLNKTGSYAGQTQPHYHMHLIFTHTPSGNFWGILNTFLKMIWKPSPLAPDILEKRVTQLKQELKALEYPEEVNLL